MLLDRARQFAGQYIDGLEERPVFPSEKSLRAMHALLESNLALDATEDADELVL